MPEVRVALYARVSTVDQVVEPQLERLREWAARMDFKVAHEDHDIASGKLVDRPGQERIMAKARGHHVHAVAVAKVDRWARNLRHVASSAAELQDLGVDFYIVDQGFAIRKADPMSKLILHVMAAFAEWEADIISERTKDGLRGKVGRGKHKRGCGVEFPCPTGVHCDRCGTRCRRAAGGSGDCPAPAPSE